MEIQADWIVDRVTLSSDARRHGPSTHYRLHVEGRNLSMGGEVFLWAVKDVSNPRYDLSRARIDDDARPYLGQ